MEEIAKCVQGSLSNPDATIWRSEMIYLCVGHSQTSLRIIFSEPLAAGDFFFFSLNSSSIVENKGRGSTQGKGKLHHSKKKKDLFLSRTARFSGSSQKVETCRTSRNLGATSPEKWYFIWILPN